VPPSLAAFHEVSPLQLAKLLFEMKDVKKSKSRFVMNTDMLIVNYF
jgi:hypothetical protein